MGRLLNTSYTPRVDAAPKAASADTTESVRARAEPVSKVRLEPVVNFRPLELPGAFVIEPEFYEDHRGFFARTFCQQEFAERGLKPVVVQASIAFNHKAGTVRGMHFQYRRAAETKVVRVTRGALLDVIVDLRPESPTYLHHAMVTLNASNRRALYIPERFAHGYQTLEDETEAEYQMGSAYAPEYSGGLSPFDPCFAIGWPLPVTGISERDATWRHLEHWEDELKAKMAV